MTTPRDRFYTLAGDILEIILQWMKSPTATRIERRVDLLSRASVLPGGGFGDTNAIAACLDLEESGATAQLNKNNVPRAKPGASNLFRFPDVAGEFTTPVARPSKPIRHAKGGKR